MRPAARSAPLLRRARPLLGTLVELRVEGLAPGRAARAIGRAFDEIAAVHRLMSFHEADSDLSRLHRARHGVRVDPRTREVLSCALDVAAASDGIFDPTIALHQVARGLLPRPPNAREPHPDADWRDIEIVGATHVRLARPLWIDLGGIAKGYAVDRALAILVEAGATQACVNAGGDLRVAGRRREIVEIRAAPGSPAHAALEIADAALATSAVTAPFAGGAHFDGASRIAVRSAVAASVVAPTCMVADALTKVVLAAPTGRAARALARFGAQGRRFTLAKAQAAA